jgi:hypothetical protein
MATKKTLELERGKKHNDGIWRPEEDERLNQSAPKANTEPKGDINCIHCGRLFFAYESSAGYVGLCDYCLHQGD